MHPTRAVMPQDARRGGGVSQMTDAGRGTNQRQFVNNTTQTEKEDRRKKGDEEDEKKKTEPSKQR